MKSEKISKLEILRTFPGIKLALHKISYLLGAPNNMGKGIEQLNYYDSLGEECLREFKERLLQKTHSYIKKDRNPHDSVKSFADEIEFPELSLDRNEAKGVKERLLKPENLKYAFNRLTDSKFIKDTPSVFISNSDGICRYKKLNIEKEKQYKLIFAILEGLLVSNCIDSNIDKDEDLEFLNEYKLIGSKVLEIAREDCLEVSEKALEFFNEGLKDANIGQHKDKEIKENPRAISYEKMERCFKKYEVIGTAAKMLSWSQEPFEEINYEGGYALGKSAGTIDDFQDTLKKNKMDIPSWQFYYSYFTKNVKKGFRLALERGKNYLRGGEIAKNELPFDYPILPYLEVIFLALDMQLHVFYNRAIKKTSQFEEELKLFTTEQSAF